METTRITLPKITLIGKCGSSKDGKDFVRDLWTELNKNFSEISYLAKWDLEMEVDWVRHYQWK